MYKSNKMKRITVIFLFTASFTFGQQKPDVDTQEMERMIDISYTESERDSLKEGLYENVSRYRSLHQQVIPNHTPPALIFNPIPEGFEIPESQHPRQFPMPEVQRPTDDSELAFMSVAEQSYLIRTGKLTSEELTSLYISRLRKYSDTLECTVSLLEDRAMTEARRADAEIADGKYRGPLHGIPYGLKDLFAVKGTVTSWGAAPYKDQHIDMDATVVRKLREAGAVLVAKLTLGALAMGDVWYGGKTRNPWNLQQGSSGSSAGPGAATAAGLVSFSIGTETLGSIVSPSNRNGVTGLRPTFGRVSRAGGMTLSWSMDKTGPMCRTALDCALVLEAIEGADELDAATIGAPYNYSTLPSDLRVGYVKSQFERDYYNRTRDSITLQVFREMGFELLPVSLPDFDYNSMLIILAAEAAAAFDQLTRSNLDDQLVRQGEGAWPNYFRTARFIPAVEYIQANRLRFQMIQEFNKLFKEVDVIISPSFGSQLLATNLSGHPVIAIPNGWNDQGSPTSFSIVGRLFDEGTILELGRRYQQATNFDEQHPPLFK